MAVRSDIPEHLQLSRTLQITDLNSLKLACQSMMDIFKPGIKAGLMGPLGAGKTAFVKIFCKEKGISQEEVVSPSYTIMHEYHTASGELIQHWDLYRLGDAPEELFDPFLEALHFIEWPDRSAAVMAQLDILIIIDFMEGKRTLKVYQAII